MTSTVVTALLGRRNIWIRILVLIKDSKILCLRQQISRKERRQVPLYISWKSGTSLGS